MRSPAQPAPRPRSAPTLVILAYGVGLIASMTGAPMAAAQEGVVAGVVVGAQTLQPLAQAQVSIDGTTLGTLSDEAGRFRISGLSSAEVTLVVRRIGYEPRRLSARAGETNVRIALSTRIIELNELVVTGTPGATERRALGTDVTQVNAAEVMKTAPVPSLQALINGRAPGTTILPSSGVIGAGATVRIRGVSSLSLSNQPLIYIDGVRVDNAQGTGPLNQSFGASTTTRWNDINPDDIESIEIVKGAAAATLYGTEAAHGVIQIITKHGAQGRTTWSFTTKQGVNQFADPKGRLWTNYRRLPDNTIGALNMVAHQDSLGRALWRNGRLQTYDVGLSGGSAQLRYYVGGQYETNEGVEPTNKLDHYSGRANLSLSPTENFDITTSLGYTSGRTTLPAEAGYGGLTWTTYYADPAKLTTRRLGFYSGLPEAYYKEYEMFQDVNRVTGSVQLNHRTTNWLTQRLVIGTDFGQEYNQELAGVHPDLSFFFGSDADSGYIFTSGRSTTYSTADYGLTAKVDLTPSLVSSTSGGAQYYHKFTRTMGATGFDFPPVPAGLKTVDATTSGFLANGDYFANTTLGGYVQQQFAWNNRFFVTAGVRGDDNSAFGKDFKAAYYPKASASWVVAEEPSASFGAINSLRVRAAYGESGFQPDVFDALRTYAAVTGPGGSAAVIPQSTGNSRLGPERTRETELGFDAGFLNHRAGLEFTYYTAKVSDVILAQNLPPSGGFSGQRFINAGRIGKHGIELLLKGNPYRTESADLNLTLSLASNKSTVDDLNGQSYLTSSRYIEHHVGYDVGGWWARRVVSAQVDANGKYVAGSAMCDGGPGRPPVRCSAAPNVFLGRSLPNLEGAFTPSLTVGQRWRFGALLDFKRGYKKLDGNRRVRCHIFQICRENFYPKEFDAVTLAQVSTSTFVDDLIQDASFTKLRELSATYTLPGALAARFNAASASVTVAGRNLRTWTNYKGLEPEATFQGGSRGGFGAWEQAVTPQLRTFVGSFNLTF
ncbi:MAG: SusC/RagA family TonB-linked outer membrane protein [Gemmatimonadaceae bacterium]